MSEIIKLNMKKKKLNVSLKNPFETNNFETEKEEDYFQNQLKQHYEHGFAEGQKAAHEKLELEYKDKLLKKFNELNDILADVNGNMAAYGDNFERIVVDLALAIAEKVVRKEIVQSRAISDVLQESLRRVMGANRIIIKINPEDLDELNSESDQLFKDDSFAKIKFEPDRKIERGGCLVETEIGNVDARVSSQFSEVKKSLEAVFTNSGI